MMSLVVNVLAQPATLQEGQELLLSCSVKSQALEESFLSVAWLKGSVELARIGPTGILSVGPEYRARANERELQAARTAAGDYSLILQTVRTEDQGEYSCRAWPQDRRQDGGFTEGAAQDSSSKQVSISTTGQHTYSTFLWFTLDMYLHRSISVKEGCMDDNIVNSNTAPCHGYFCPCESACVLLTRIIEKILHRSSPNP